MSNGQPWGCLIYYSASECVFDVLFYINSYSFKHSGSSDAASWSGMSARPSIRKTRSPIGRWWHWNGSWSAEGAPLDGTLVMLKGGKCEECRSPSGNLGHCIQLSSGSTTMTW